MYELASPDRENISAVVACFIFTSGCSMQHRAETALNRAPHEKYWFCTRKKKRRFGTRGSGHVRKKNLIRKKKKPIEEERRISIGTECKREHIIL